MRYQTYVLHLIDGTAIPMVEDYDLPAEKGIVGHFSKAAPDEIFYRGRPAAGLCLYPQEQHCLPGNRRSDCEVIFWKSRSTGKSVTTPNPCFSG